MNLAQDILFPEKFPYKGMPTTRYQGSKRKLLPELHKAFLSITFDNCIDAFGGTGSVTHLLKNMGKKVQYNDILPANAIMARALFANRNISIDEDFIKKLFIKKRGKVYYDYISENYRGVYFTDEENQQLDILAQNIIEIEDELARVEAYYCLFQSAISKRPYNLFHRANLDMRLKNVKRNFGNKATWDKLFIEHMFKFYKELRRYRKFTSKYTPKISCNNAFQIEGTYDLVYIDTPYAKSNKTQETNYFNFYHFLDAILDYYNIENRIFKKFAHKPIYKPNKTWYTQDNIDEAFKALFLRFKDSKLVISYRSDGYPSPKVLVSYLKKNFANVDLIHLSDYKYVLSTNKNDTQELIISTV